MFDFYVDPEVEIQSAEFNKLKDKIKEELKLDVLPEPNRFSYFNKETNYSQHFVEKIKSIESGIMYLLNIIAPHKNHEGISAYFSTFSDSIPKQISQLNDLKNNRAEIGKFFFALALRLRPYLKEFSPEFLTDDQIKDNLRILKLIDRAEEFYLASQPRPTICTVIKVDEGVLHAQLDTPLNTFKPTLNNVENPIYQVFQDIIAGSHPAWFTRLPILYQKLATPFIQTVINNPDSIYTLSSRTEIIPGLRNLYRHYSFVAIQQEVNVTSTFRSSHIAGVFDNTEYELNEEDQFNFAKLNFLSLQLLTYELFKTQKEKLSLLFQTLVTPVIKSDDLILSELKGRVLENQNNDPNHIAPVNLTILESNHAINAARFVKQSNDSPLNAHQSEPQTPLQITVLTKLNELLDLNPLQYLSKMAESQIHVASLEEFYARLSTDIIAYCSCKSGKDRAGLKILNTDAIHLFHELNQELPVFFNEPKFYGYLEKLFLSIHPSLIANENSWGAFGLKELANNAPLPLIQRIKGIYPDFLAIQNTLGSLNTVLAIFKKTEIFTKFYKSSNNSQKRIKDFDALARKKTDIASLKKINAEIIAFLKENTQKNRLQHTELSIANYSGKKNITSYLSPAMRDLILESKNLIDSLQSDRLMTIAIEGKLFFIDPETKNNMTKLLLIFKDAPFNMANNEYQFCKKIYDELKIQFEQLTDLNFSFLNNHQLSAIKKRKELGKLIASSKIPYNRKLLSVPDASDNLITVGVSDYFLRIYDAYQNLLCCIIRNDGTLKAFDKLQEKLKDKPIMPSRSNSIRMITPRTDMENSFIKHIREQLPFLLTAEINGTLEVLCSYERMIPLIMQIHNSLDDAKQEEFCIFLKHPQAENLEIFLNNSLLEEIKSDLENLYNLLKEKNDFESFRESFKEFNETNESLSNLVKRLKELPSYKSTPLLIDCLDKLNKLLNPEPRAIGKRFT